MSQKNQMNRRRFFNTSMTGIIGTGLLYGTGSDQEPQDKKTKIKEYRTLGRTGFKVSDIGYGAGGLSNPNVLEAGLDMGINYIDTAEHYAGGQSETAIGKVLKKRDRKSIFLTTKLNLTFGGGKTKEALKERFHKCLARLQTDYVDCFMIHMTPSADEVKYEPFHELVKELKAEGKVRFTGLSNHGQEHKLASGPLEMKDSMEKVILTAAEDGRFDVALFVYNFIQKKQGEEIIKACKAKNMGVTLMKMDPINFFSSVNANIARTKKAGKEIGEATMKMVNDYKGMIEQAESFKKKHNVQNESEIRDASIKFVLGNPDVHSVCPTMNTFDKLNAFTALSGQKLQTADNSMLNDYKTQLGHLYCRHACGICEPTCPNNIPVNKIMRYNHYFEAHGREKHAMVKYANMSESNVSKCQNCSGHCTGACPYNVPIRSLLMLAHQNLSLT